jgi:hypothetical protein
MLRPASAAAQTPTAPAPAPAPALTADPKDVASQDAILGALYDVISGPAGKRDWDRFRSLFIPGARLIPTSVGPDGARQIRVIAPDEFATMSAPQLEASDFFEREIGRTSDSFGTVAHVFSAYDSKRAASDAQPFARGINSIQLFDDGKRWWVVTIFWDSERGGNVIPSKYLRGGQH